jgi:hypothetical protein
VLVVQVVLLVQALAQVLVRAQQALVQPLVAWVWLVLLA